MYVYDSINVYVCIWHTYLFLTSGEQLILLELFQDFSFSIQEYVLASASSALLLLSVKV
jgi:hypothetical protein